MIHYAYPLIIYLGLPLLCVLAFLRWYFYQPLEYRYALASYGKKLGYGASQISYSVMFMLRFSILATLLLLAARPQLVDTRSKLDGQGIDIMLVLDISRSMECFDSLQDKTTRFASAQTEALRFIQKRPHDQIGLVFFAKDALVRCPLTLDKKMLEEMVRNSSIGTVDPDGTVLSIALSIAANRLKLSNAKTKIIILLTDGEPTPELDINPSIAIDLAKKFGIKIYTIGIGGEEGGYIQDPLFGVRSVGIKLNTKLLADIAQQTGGKFFHARKNNDMKIIYDTIDTLEKSTYKAEVFANYYDLVIPFLIIILILLGIEYIAATWIWFFL